MKLSNIILEKKVIERVQLNLSENDIEILSEAITKKLDDYIDVGNRQLLLKSVQAAIQELTVDTEN